MTLKDQFDIQGYDSTLGYVGRAFRPADQDCVLVALLKQMGAVIIAKSNLPQSIMVSTLPRLLRVSLSIAPPLTLQSGVRLKTLFLVLLCTRRILSLPLEAPQVERVRYSPYTAR